MVGLLKQLEEARKEVARQVEEIVKLRANQFLLQCFLCDKKNNMFYNTGFGDYSTLKGVFLTLQPTAETMVRWSQVQCLKKQMNTHLELALKE